MTMERLINWWNSLPGHIDPVMLQFGPFQLRYYSLMYLTAILVFYALTRHRLKSGETALCTEDAFDSYMTYAIVGVVCGARLGYVLFYNFSYFISNPVEIFWPYHEIDGQAYFGISGLSYHGGLLGALLATWLFCRRHKIKFWPYADFLVPAVPLGYMFGRIGNFLNGELYGRVTSVPWGMYFPSAATRELRHPSQLYEAFFEGLVLFVILWGLRRKKLFPGFLFSLYVTGYGLVRFFIEYVREPDGHLGMVLWSLSLGQVLCVVMAAAGGTFMLWAGRRPG
jgi:phosphatidylglycerol:prolipoprotein diacylglycerol transferase